MGRKNETTGTEDMRAEDTDAWGGGRGTGGGEDGRPGRGRVGKGRVRAADEDGRRGGVSGRGRATTTRGDRDGRWTECAGGPFWDKRMFLGKNHNVKE